MYIKDLRELGFTGFEKNSYIKFNMSKSQMGSDGIRWDAENYSQSKSAIILK